MCPLALLYGTRRQRSGDTARKKNKKKTWLRKSEQLPRLGESARFTRELEPGTSLTAAAARHLTAVCMQTTLIPLETRLI